MEEGGRETERGATGNWTPKEVDTPPPTPADGAAGPKEVDTPPPTLTDGLVAHTRRLGS